MHRIVCRIWVATGVALMLGGAVHADRVGAGSQIPTANSESVSTYRNRTVAIRLSATTGSTSRLTFTIGNRPKFGTLSEILPVDGENAMAEVMYTPDPAATAGLDQFTFKAQVTGEPPSPTAPVQIRILNPQPRLQVEGPVEFKKVRVGEVGRSAFVVRNIGQARFRGRIELLSPWVLDRDVLEVEPGAVERVTVEFRPRVPGKVGTRLQLQAGEEGALVGIYAEAVAPFTLQPGSVELVGVPGGSRRGNLQVVNATTEPMVISIHSPIDPDNPSSRLNFPSKVELSGGEKKEVRFELPAGDRTQYDEALTFSSKLYSAEVGVRSKALPASLALMEPVPDSGWDFGEISLEQAVEPKTFRLVNEGGAPLVATVKVSPPFALSGIDKSVEISGGEEIEVTVLPDTRNAGEFSSGLEFEHSGGTLVIPLRMVVALPDSAMVETVGPEIESPLATAPAPEGRGAETTPAVAPVPKGTSVSARPETLWNPEDESPGVSVFNGLADVVGRTFSDKPFDLSLPSAKNLKFVDGDHRSVILSWDKAGPGVEDYMFERVQMFQDMKAGGRIIKGWIPWEGKVETMENKGGSMKVRLEPFLSSTEYEMRVVALNEFGNRALPSEVVTFTMGIPVSGWKTFFKWVWIVSGVLAVFVLFRLYQYHRDHAERGRVHTGSDQGGVRGMLEGLRIAIFRQG